MKSQAALRMAGLRARRALAALDPIEQHVEAACVGGVQGVTGRDVVTRTH